MKDNINIHTLPIHFGKKIIGSEGGDSKPDIDIPNRHIAITNLNIISNIIYNPLLS